MPERFSKRKVRRDSLTSSLGEPEASRQRTENAPSISDKDFTELSDKVEKSVCRRIKDTETGQWEILKMIENLSSKIYSLTNKTPSVVNVETTETDLTEPVTSSQRAEMYELPQGESHHMVTRVAVPQEIPTRSSSLPQPNQKYSDDIVSKLLESLKNVTKQNLGLPKLPKALSTTMPTFDGRNDKFEHFEDLFTTSLKVYLNISEV